MNNEKRTITVHGVGKCTVKPDCVILNMIIEERGKIYSDVIESVNRRIASIKESVVRAGISEDDVKTTAFNICAENERRRIETGAYITEFKSFLCSHRLRVQFEFTSRLLNSVLTNIATSGEPDFFISFGISDKDGLSDELLRGATSNARHKAETLMNASGKKLGELISVDYSFGEFEPVSPTQVRTLALEAANVSVSPEDISVSDSATFTWEII